MWSVLILAVLSYPRMVHALCSRSVNLISSTGVIESDNYPRRYRDSTNCQWNIAVPGSKIKITFDRNFGIEAADGCGYDFLQIYSVSNRGALSVGKYCGNAAPNQITINSSRALLKFVSDSSVNGTGFKISYTVVSNGGWGNWGPYVNSSSCSKSCGVGVQEQTKTRPCDNPPALGGGTPCPGNSTYTREVSCKIKECPINGNWSDWGDYRDSGICSATCNSGEIMQISNRTCDNPTPMYDGEYCFGDQSRFRYVNCTMNPCPVHGGWSRWSDYVMGNCSVSCGSGQRTYTSTRTCTSPAPTFGGQNCTGSNSISQMDNCTMDLCPIDGGWGDWSNWEKSSGCSVTCGEGMQEEKRNRTCNNPEPMYSGQECSDSSEEGRTVECSQPECTGICSVDGTQLPYARDFTKYYECENYEPVLKSCPYGNRWDKTTSRCIKVCASFRAELQAYPTDCYKYVQCVWGFHIVMYCPAGTAWSTVNQVCIHADDVDCTYEASH